MIGIRAAEDITKWMLQLRRDRSQFGLQRHIKRGRRGRRKRKRREQTVLIANITNLCAFLLLLKMMNIKVVWNEPTSSDHNSQIIIKIHFLHL